jgi:hypothetical protein
LETGVLAAQGLRRLSIDWLVAMDPFRRPADAEHYAEGLRKAGFE